MATPVSTAASTRTDDDRATRRQRRPRSDRRPWFDPRLAIVAVGLLALGFGVACTSALWGDLAGRIVEGNLPDALHYSWWLGHTPHALSNGQTPLRSADQNWPIGVSAMNNTSLLLPAVLLAPITWLATSLATLNTLNLLAIPACAAAGYWALRRLSWGEDERLGRASALVGAVAFAISPAIVNSLVGHITMAFAPAMPVLVGLGVEAWSEHRSRWTGVLLGLVTTAQFFTGEEVLFQAVFAVLIILLVAALSRRHAVAAAGRRLAISLTQAFVIFVPFAVYPLYLQFFGPLKEHGTPFPPKSFGADVSAFTTPTKHTLLHTAGQAAASAKFDAGIEEHLAYLGWPLLVCCLLTLVFGWRRLTIRCAGVTLLVSLLLSLGAQLWVNGVPTGTPGPYWLIAQVPVLNGSLSTRFGLLSALAAGAVLAFAVDWLSKEGLRLGGRSGRGGLVLSPATGTLLAAGLSLVCLVPLLPGRLGVIAAPAVPAYFTTQARTLPNHSVVLVAPYPWAQDPVAMRWQTEAHYRFRMVGGYFLGPGLDGHAYVDGHTTSETASLLKRVLRTGQPAANKPERRAAILAELAKWKVDEVVLGPSAAEAALQQTISGLVGFQPVATGGVQVWNLRRTPLTPQASS